MAKKGAKKKPISQTFRTFGGKQHGHVSCSKDQESIKKTAANRRKKGKVARVFQTGENRWCIYGDK